MPELLIGLGISNSTTADPIGEATLAEALGFDFVSASDHPVGAEPTYETPTLLTWIAARTTRITVVSRVLGVPFRRPAVLAKSTESVHRLSGGRVVLGLGAGYSDAEIRALGGRGLSPGEKVVGLGEAVEIIRGAWTGAGFSYAGTVHTVADLTLAPRPSSRIPIWLGTFGNRALAVTGRLADGWIPSYGHAPPARIPELRDRIATAAVAAGRAPEAVRGIYNVPVRVDPHGPAMDGVLVGPAADIVERLREFVELGFGGFNLMPAGDDLERQVRLLGENVLPAIRD
ncbi:MAG: LLM class flavin-dependent oxidoreductase [Jatrophihabitans sp.]|uniref:LLM class flavin-dependent oxidoreductase n=1 Tax=Jatrophihabitans sp. TaxID=1932789 RepID=UPI003911E9EC